MEYEAQGLRDAKEDDVKKRRITSKDFDRIEKFIENELDARKTSQFRKNHESQWKEIDRQIEMKPMQRLDAAGKTVPTGWHNVIELGELAKASEIITADVVRIAFSNENWLEAHVQLEGKLNPQTGEYVISEDVQEKADGLLRALMLQQQKDFGFKARVKLSIKEALHHGSFVAEIRWEDQLMNDGAKVKTVGAPVWVPHSMWNCYPDPSPSIIGTNLFYTGSMIIVEYMPLWRLKRLSGKGWMPGRIARVKKEEHKDKDNDTQDVQLVKWFGDISLERQDGDIYLPNMKCILANGTLIYAEPNELAYPSVIFSGYERQDVRDPYYTSPIIKQSPMQKFTTVMANKFADAIDLRTEPPIEYDANDPDYVLNGGPQIHPGAKSATKSMGKGFKIVEIGDPQAAFAAVQFGFRQLQEGLGVSSLRQGVATSDRQTATEAKLMEAGSEVRTIDFIGTIEHQGLRPWLYLQHAWNRKKLKEYHVYSNEMNTPDIVRFTSKEVDVEAHFDVVGAKGILGEKERQQKVAQTVAFLTSNPVFGPIIARNAERIAQDLLRDAGKKNPEEWIPSEKGKPQVPPQMMQQMQGMAQEMKRLQQELQAERSGNQVAMAKLQADTQLANQEFALEMRKVASEQNFERQQAMMDSALERWKATLEANTKIRVAKINAAAKPKAPPKAA